MMGTYYQIVQPPYILLSSAQAAMLGAIGFALVAIDREISKWTLEALKSRVMAILVIACILVPLPIFVASDHGRFLHLWFGCALIVLATFVSCRSPLRTTSPSAEPAPQRGGELARSLWILVFVAYATTWSARGPCCPDRLGSGFFGRVLLLVAQRL